MLSTLGCVYNTNIVRYWRHLNAFRMYIVLYIKETVECSFKRGNFKTGRDRKGEWEFWTCVLQLHPPSPVVVPSTDKSQSPLKDLLLHSFYHIRFKKTPVFLTYKINTSSIAFFWGRNISTPREVCLYMMLFPQIKRISFLMGVGGGERSW